MSLFCRHALALALFVNFVNTDGALVTSAYGQTYSQASTRSAAAAPKSFSYDDLVSLIKTQNLKSVGDVIPKLPKSIRQSFTLMYDSKSLQKSTETHPRAILFGDDAKFIITFGGDPAVPASKNLEILEFKEKTATFSLHEVSFEDSLPHFATPEEIKNKCTSCHGLRPRPIWERTYPDWRGAYGEKDDVLNDRSQQGYGFAYSNQEAAYVKFRTTTAQSPAFKSLYEGHEKDLIWPFSRSIKDRVTATMPNYRLNLLLTVLSSQQLGTQAINSNLFPHLKYKLLSSFYCSDNTHDERFIEILSKYASIPIDENWNETRSSWEKEMSHSKALRGFDIPFGSTGLYLDRVNLHNGSSTGLTPNGPFGRVLTTESFLYSYIAKQMATTDAMLARNQKATYKYDEFKNDSYSNSIFRGFSAALTRYGLSGQFNAPCDYINSKADEEIQKLNIPPLQMKLDINIETRNDDLPTIERGRNILLSAGCVACHSSGRAPNISFTRSDVFNIQNTQSLQKDGVSLLDKVKFRISSSDSSQRMPLGGRQLTQAEQDSLLGYLKSITDRP